MAVFLNFLSSQSFIYRLNFFCSFLERDAFDALFDNAPEKLNVVKKVLYMQFNFGEIMAALKVPVRYNKVHEAIAMHRFGSVKAHLDLS